ncbi:MAG: carboxypeptidase-like regulatory domain-containing protein [Planctomycetota bacterium]
MKSPLLTVVLLAVAGAGAFFGGQRLGWFGETEESRDAPTLRTQVEEARFSTEPDGGALARIEQGDRRASETEAEGRPVAESSRLLQVKVLDENGEPVRGIQLKLHRILSPWPNRRTVSLAVAYSDNEGNCRFKAPTGEDALVEVANDRFAHESILVPLGLNRRTLRLQRGFEIEGVVYWRQQPASGVEVVLEPIGLEPREARVTRTDRQGKFRFTGVRGGGAGAVRITARDDLHRPVSRTNIPVGTTQRVRLDFRVGGETLLGKVVDEQGDPIRGASISLYPSTAWNATLYYPFSDATDADGVFALTGLGPGDARMIIRHPMYSVYDRAVTVQRALSEVEVTLRPSSRVLGRLVGELPESVRLKIRSSSDDVQWADVEPDGSFEFAQTVSTGTADLEVVDGVVAFKETGNRLLSIDLEPGLQDLSLAVEESDVVVGQVVDQTGAPVRGADVSVRANWWLTDYDRVRFWTTTGETGEFEFRGLPGGTLGSWVSRYARSARPGRVEHSDFGQASFPLRSDGERTDLGEIQLDPPARIRGQVLSGGRPLAGVTVFAADQETNSAITDRQGRYEIDQLEPGTYRVFARYSTLPIQFAGEPVEVKSGEVIEELQLEFPPSERVKLRIVGENAEPVPEATVYLLGVDSPPVLTDSDGIVEVDVPEAATDFEVVSPTGDLRAIFPRDERELKLLWLSRFRVTGAIVDLGVDAPSAAVLRATPLDEVSEEQHLRQREIEGRLIDLDRGQFEVFLPAGPSRVTIDVPGYLPYVTEIDPSNPEEAELGAIRLQRGAKIRGRIFDPEGNPLAGGLVRQGPIEDLLLRSVRGDAFTNGLFVVTDEDGRFELSGLSTEAAMLCAVAPGCAATATRLTMPDDLFEGVEIRLREVHQIDLIAPEQSDGSGGVISIYRGDVLLDTRAPDSTGQIQLLVQVPGTYRFEISGSGRPPVKVKIGDRPLNSRGEALLIDLR